eukprot:TRINITY_DN17040_c0_g1_i1.p1 TRINITY_DN17040_c0_g1~~TRINITY_DN17040_c0_g1_i1.p1  ORF type:complete len:595 (-),score=102.56 TRINITY_DN17040_c0_g1_i1:148-1932(-)
MDKGFKGFTVRGFKLNIQPEEKQVQPRRINVGMEAAVDPKAPRFEVEMREVSCRPLSANPNFPLVAMPFCCLRLVRPMLLALCFSDGPQTQVLAAEVAVFFAWMMSFAGLAGALFVTPVFQQWLDDKPGLSDAAKDHVEPAGLVLLGVAVGFDLLHQLLAVACWDFFWSTGIVDMEKSDSTLKLPLAYVLVLLHVAGLLGSLILVIMYARNYRATWLEFALARRGKKRSRVSDARGFRDLEAGEEPRVAARRPAEEEESAAAAVESERPEQPLRPDGRPSGWRNRAGSKGPSDKAPAAHWGPREAGRDSSREPSPRPSENRSDGEGTPRGSPRDNTPPRRSKRSNSFSPQRAGSVPGGPRPSKEDSPGTAPGPERPPLINPPRAWLWVEKESGGEWVRVRVLRTSSSDCTAAVRLPGGEVIQTRQSSLRQRKTEHDEPPAAPAAAPRDRPASASAGASPGPTKFSPRPPRGRSKERPSSSCSGRGNRPPREGGSAPPGWAPLFKEDEKPETPRVQSEEEKWAKERMEKLRKELQALDQLPQTERRSRLRALQRELHPDKLPEELRAHAQPLFHLVQKEWEVNEAMRAEAQNGGA